jgi:hypothetical protein
MEQTTQRVLRKLVHEIVSDGASNWGGWQGGFPGSGSPLKGMKGGGDVGKNQKYRDVQRKPKRTNASWQVGGSFKLSGKKTKVIQSPILKQSENKIDSKNPTVAPTDMPPKKGQTVKQVKEAFAELAIQNDRRRLQEGSVSTDPEAGKPVLKKGFAAMRSAVAHQTIPKVRGDTGVVHAVANIGRRIFSNLKSAVTSKPAGQQPEIIHAHAHPNSDKHEVGYDAGNNAFVRQKGANTWAKYKKPPKDAAGRSPTQKQQKQADLDASNAKFDAWKKKKGDMARVFKQANDMGLDHDIPTPYKSFKARQASKERLKNPLKQPNDTAPETPAAPNTNTWTASKPRVRVKVVSQRAEDFRNEWDRMPLSELHDQLTMFKKPSFKMPKLGNRKFTEDAPTDNVGSGNISGFDPILSASVLKRRKKSK